MQRNVLNCHYWLEHGVGSVVIVRWSVTNFALWCFFLGFRPLSSVLVRAVPELLDNFINNSLRTILRLLL